MTQWLRPPGQQKPGIGQQLAEKAATKVATDQIAKLGLGAAGTAIGGPLGGAAGSALGELAGPLAGQLVGQLFKGGGHVASYHKTGAKVDENKSIWGKLSEKVMSDFGKRSDLFGKGQKPMPKYRAIGGMTSGPLGMPDMVIAGKDKSISAVKMKKSMGDMSEEVEVNYHPPLAAKPKPSGE